MRIQKGDSSQRTELPKIPQKKNSSGSLPREFFKLPEEAGAAVSQDEIKLNANKLKMTKMPKVLEGCCEKVKNLGFLALAARNKY